MTTNLQQLAGGALMVDIPGDTLTPEDARFLKATGIRSICLFRRNVTSLESSQKLVTDLLEVIGPDALIALDQEGGAVMRTLYLPQAPSAMALGAVGDASLAREVGAAIARGLASIGINWNYAPVADLNNNPANPVIAERSFGSDSAQAVRMLSAWIEGHLSEGVASCIKHFPGHGDTHVDSHLALPTVDKPKAELDTYELAPFKALAGISPTIMSAHIVFPAYDAELPATLSPVLLGDLLRGDMGYQGVVITDGMNMKAIRERFGQANGTVKALHAGADLSLVLEFRDEMIESQAALVSAVNGGELSIEKLQISNQRTRALAHQYPASIRAYPEAQQKADTALFDRAWQRALTAVRNPARLARGGKLRLVIQADAPSDGVSEAGLSASTLIQRLAPHYDLEVVQFASRDALDWEKLPDDDVFTVLASTTRARYGERERNNWRPDLHLALWNPYAAFDLQAPALVTYGFANAALDAVIAWLGGEIDAEGRLPVSAPSA